MSIVSILDSNDDRAVTDDPLVRLMLDRNIIQLSSTLIAKLEYVRYDENRLGVFKTKWVNEMFHVTMSRLYSNPFNINEWFASIIAKNPAEWKDKYEIKPSKFSQTVDTNWMLHLLEMEKMSPGFMILLHNCFDLEDSTASKMVEKSKKEDEYDFLGLGARNKATQQLLGHQESHRCRLTGK